MVEQIEQISLKEVQVLHLYLEEGEQTKQTKQLHPQHPHHQNQEYHWHRLKKQNLFDGHYVFLNLICVLSKRIHYHRSHLHLQYI